MDAVAFYFFYAINWTITLLPLRMLYPLASLIYFLLYYFPGYRRKIVSTNLRNAFPEKSESELRHIAKRFYSHLADMFVETMKLTHMSRKELRERVQYENRELIDRLYSEGRDIVAVVGHYNNWEWTRNITEISDYIFIPVYKPLKNKYFDRFIIKIRSEHGAIVTPMSMVIRELINYRKKGKLTFSAYLADQTPTKDDIQYWTTFLGQDTPVYLGAEKIALKYDMAVVFLHLHKVKRGYYSLEFELLFEHTAGLKDHQITDTHVRRLEEIIRQKPEYWVWSHRRWKHKKEPING